MELKVVLVGNPNVGKTSIISRYISNCMPVSDDIIDCQIKELSKNGQLFKLHIWDTAGQEKYRTLTSTFYKDANIVIFVFDLTDKESFDDISLSWVGELSHFGLTDCIKILIGNKIDLTDELNVTEADLQKSIKTLKMQYFGVSALTGEGIDNIFETLLQMEIESQQKEIEEQQIEIKNETIQPMQLVRQPSKPRVSAVNVKPENKNRGCYI
eukprot:TRINITY_DN1504_c3_g1_i1.p1 TRINITY_DN1504_c3_g1~~TRINITY_DN1504_c3_g1_i1.p1  ORF type:complete len:212 (-),score=90.99 TRINITY_DN1504_c3_g1_i1:88-723(-)